MLEKPKNAIRALIKSSERVFRTDMNYVAKNGSWVLLGQAISVVLTLLLSVAFANLFPMHEYGVYKYLLSFIGIVAAFKLTGMPNAVVQATSRGFDKTLLTAMRASLTWGLIPQVFYIAGTVYYLLNGNLLIAASIFVAGTLNVLIGAFGLYGSFLHGKQMFKLSYSYSVITQVTNAALILTALLLTHNVFLIVLVNFLSTGLFVFFFSWKTKKLVDEQSTSDDKSLSYGKHLSLMNVLTGIVNNLDKIFIFQRLGAIELALYSFAIAIPEQLRGVIKNFFSIIFPKYATLTKEQLRRSVRQKIVILTLATAALTLVYIIAAPFIFTLLFPKYIDSVMYSQIYILGLLGTPGILLFNAYFQVQQKTDYLYRINLIGSALGLTLTIVLIFFFGLLGAALQNIVYRVLNIFLCFYYFMKDRGREV